MESGDWTSWTPEKEERFFKKLVATGGNVFKACKLARVARSTAYYRKDNDPEFAARWIEAEREGTANLEEEAYRRAFKGVKRSRGIYYQDQLLERQIITEYSDTLTIFLLKARDPEKYQDRMRQEVSGIGGGPITTRLEYSDLSDAELDARISELATSAKNPVSQAAGGESLSPGDAAAGDNPGGDGGAAGDGGGG